MTNAMAMYEPQTFHLEPMAPVTRYSKHHKSHKRKPHLVRDYAGSIEQEIVLHAQKIYAEQISDY